MNKGALLWSVTKQGYSDGYVFGTMHIRDKIAFSHLDRVLPLIEVSEIYAAELDLADIDMSRMHSVSTLPKDTPVSSFYTARRFSRMQKSILKSFGIDICDHPYVHPFLLASNIVESVFQRDHVQALDHHLWTLAEGFNLTMTGLESFEDQMQIMESIPLKGPIKQLTDLARNPRRYRKGILKMLRQYEDQNIVALYKSSKKQLGDLRYKLLYRRNLKMAHRIEHLMSKGRLFSSFGAAHLAGEKGVLRHLKNLGCTLRPIR